MMAATFRCLPFRVPCHSSVWVKNNQGLDVATNRISAGVYVSHGSTNNLFLFTEKPKASVPQKPNVADQLLFGITNTTLPKEKDGLLSRVRWKHDYAFTALGQHLEAQQMLCTDENTILCSKEKEIHSNNNTMLSNSSAENVKPNNDRGLPSPSQLDHVFKVLSETLPRLFIQSLDYSIYSSDIVFDNRIRGTRTVGIYNYIKQVAMLRTIAHLKYAFVRFEVLKITQHQEEGTIKVRWRIRGISGLRVLFTFWKYRLWQWKELMDKQEAWYDGFSTFHVSSQGTVYLHIADKMMPDEEKVSNESGRLAAKLALLLGLLPKPSRSDMADIVGSVFLAMVEHK